MTDGKRIISEGLTRGDYLSARTTYHDPQVGNYLFGPMLRGVLEQLLGLDLYLVRRQHSHCQWPL